MSHEKPYKLLFVFSAYSLIEKQEGKNRKYGTSSIDASELSLSDKVRYTVARTSHIISLMFVTFSGFN